MHRRSPRLLAAIMALVPLGLTGCGLNEFDVPQTAEATIPAGSVLDQVLNTFPEMKGFNNFDFSQSQEFKNENAQKDHVKHAKLASFTLKITSPDDQDFGFLDSIAFFAEANGNKARVAHKENIGSLGLETPNPTLTLDLDDEDLEPFVTADRMSFTTQATGRQPSKETHITGTAVVHVTVGL